MKKGSMIYEGKAKQLFETEDKDKVLVHYKDDATAFNGVKKGQIHDKGIVNNTVTSLIFQLLEKEGIPTHFIDRISDREQLCRKVDIIPLEVIVRNVIAGSMAKRLAIPEGTEIPNTIFEICYKKDELGDPLINDHHAVALGAATYEELDEIYSLTGRINRILIDFFASLGLRLVDFKLEFGKDEEGNILLADEISQDTCRLWDIETGKKMDKDRFRRDLGEVEETYMELLKRVESKLK
ncbi:MAG: phosphoribosylaminoimidazolesuccinocarboxamide synthase [Spirochaetes bacterium]|nr:MAG: phosphoribosylaminoimidazolesuccinocarboxamide synthase [Spirochaetota bacterium]